MMKYNYFLLLILTALVTSSCGDSRVIDPPLPVTFTVTLDAVVPPTTVGEPAAGGIHAHLSDDAGGSGGAIFISGRSADLDITVPGSFITAIAQGAGSFTGSRLNIDAELFPQTGLLSGFNTGETVYFRAYPINGSVIEYTYDKDGKLTFANYGAASNVLAFVLK
ncbi:MAG TPA: hypothetical protein VFO76_04430 [Candidatus Kapabacteria bacterium]|nr:hypothetical protein [Candidatus Kapabacteria bacterium]